MAINFAKIFTGLRFVPVSTTAVAQAGDCDFATDTNKLRVHNGTSSSPIVTEAHTATLTNKSLDDTTVTVTNTADATKQIKMSAGGGATATATTIASSQTVNRTVTLPDATDTLVGKATTDTLTNKSIDATTNTISNIANANIKAAAAIAVNKLASVTANKALASDASGFITPSATTDTELGYVSGVTSSIQTQLNSKQSSTLTNSHILVGNGSNVATDVAVSGDVSITNTGATTVNTVGTSSAANIHTAEQAANAATNLNTASTIVKRDASGNFSAGMITANLTGNASGTAANVTGVVAIANGGTNLTSFTTGDILYASAANTLSKLPAGTSGQVLTQGASVPSWSGAPSPASITENAQTGTAYTLALSDAGKLVSLANSSAVAVTVPPNSSVAFPVGTIIQLLNNGTGKVSAVAGSGVTILSKNSNLGLSAQYSQGTLVKHATDTWYFYGDLAPASFIVATGGVITTNGNYKVHTFNSSGTFQITSGNGLVSSLVIGGGGGSSGYGGGGGAGGVVYTTPGSNYGVGSYSVVVGAGGGGNSYASGLDGAAGSSSSFDTITASGGGAGAYYSHVGGNGASGGGGGGSASNAGGSGTTGYSGGTGANNGSFANGGGGGGAGGAGGNAIGTGTGGNGGVGITNSITGTAVTYASGGGGGTSGSTPGTASAGGGGNGGTTNGTSGTANTGGGGGGAGSGTGGSGGSGVVIITYQYQ